MDQNRKLREHILYLLRGGGAHGNFDDAVADFASPLRGAKMDRLPYTAWQLLEHMRLAQWDILDFSRNPKYREMKFPDDYWPKSKEPPTPNAWE